MNLKDIERLAGHRAVPPWVVKLVGDAVAEEREACAQIAKKWIHAYPHPSAVIEEEIRARGNP